MIMLFIVKDLVVSRNSRNLIPERLLNIHGKWKSDSAKDMYVEESLENRLHVMFRFVKVCIK